MRYAMLMTAALFMSTTALADDKPPAKFRLGPPKEIPTKDLKIAFPQGGKPTTPTEITNADQLAKSPALKGATDDIKKHVNFEKEKLVFFAWTGSSGDGLTGTVLLGEVTVAHFTHTTGVARDQRPHVRLFVVPNDALVLASSAADRPNEALPLPGLQPPRVPEIPGLREISASGLKVTFPADPGGAANPEIITSAEQLSESPALKDAAEEIKKQVDFGKEKLVFVAWLGSYSDRFTIERSPDDTKATVSFRVRPGSALDYSERIRLFVIPKDMGVRTAGR